MTFKSHRLHPDLPGVKEIMPDDLQENRNNVLMIDVRRPDEFVGELGHIPGSRLIVLDHLAEHLPTLPKDKAIVFICRSGSRSARATAMAQQAGFHDVYNMIGGMILWNELGLETDRKAPNV